MLGHVLGFGNMGVNKTDKSFTFMKLTSIGGKHTINKLTKRIIIQV